MPPPSLCDTSHASALTCARACVMRVVYGLQLLEYVEREFLQIKKKQADLLGLEDKAVEHAVRSKL